MYEAATYSIRELTLREFLWGAVKFLAPLVLAALYVLYIYSLGEAGAILLPLLGAYFFPPFGKESVIPLGISLGVHPAVMALSIAMVDILVGLFLLWNYRVLYYVPLLGKWARKMERKAQKLIQEGKGTGKLAWLGLVLFVIVPFQGSGAVTATILGKMGGMDAKKVWSAVIVGALAGTFMIAYSFHLLLDAFRSDPLLGLTVVAAFAVAVIILVLRWQRTTGEELTFEPIREVNPLMANGGVPEVAVEPPESEHP